MPYEPHVSDEPDWEPPDYAGVFQKSEVVGYHCRNAVIEALRQVGDQHA